MAALKQLVVLATALVALAQAQSPSVGGYVMLSRTDSSGKNVGLDELNALADKAASIPVTRLYLAFVSPTIVYSPNSNTLAETGLNVSSKADLGFAELKAVIQRLKAGGVETFLSIGGWNFNCFPYFYARYSIAGYGTNTPNYWKIQTFGGGSIDNCNVANQYCFVCEPPSEGTTLDAFSIFPEPYFSPTWQAAKAWVATGAPASGVTPVWNEDMIPGKQYTDKATGITTMVPGSNLFEQKKRDPYQDFVYLAKDLAVDGVDLDYEEFWHADYHKLGSGPWTLPQTVFKYSAIAYDIATNIKAIAPSLKLSTASSAVGAWKGDWWGGNLKGVWYNAQQWMPFIIDFMTKGSNAGGINVMSYDLSDNPQFHECPTDDNCPLDKQVEFYMNTYSATSMAASVGYEISTPAYPDKTHDPTHQLPLTKSMLASIISTTQSKDSAGGFLWELFKPVDSSDHASPTDVAQAICKSVMPSSPRCSGVIPAVPSNTTTNDCTSDKCNVCSACCKSYLTPQSVCDSCVASECGGEDFAPPSPRTVMDEAALCSSDRETCTTCAACCSDQIVTQASCTQCFNDKCVGMLTSNLRDRVRV